MKDTALLMLIGYKNVNLSEECYTQGKDPSYGSGAGLVLWANYEDTVLGASCMGEKGVPAEIVGQTAVENLLTEMNAKGTLDIHATDQILPFLALAKGESTFYTREISNHTKTNMWIIERFLDTKFTISNKESIEVVKVDGVGWK
jgi:RNA 3'-terminal phosphate cyclase (ATP)/RNA 3'-terminal phosphate cyclase (GTP)